jgi:hypothetical protein
MYCDKCGAHNPDNSATCRACGASLANPYQTPTAAGITGDVPQPINNYLIPAIFSTLCCCLPFGIVSIVYAAQVNGLLAGGNFAAATKAAQNAKMWFWIAFGLGLFFNGLAVILQIVAAMAGIAHQGR